MAIAQTRLFIVRHASTERIGERFQGRFEVPLSDAGKRQALLLGKKLENEIIDAVYSSPLSRARDTATIAFGSRQIPFATDDMLSARDFGLIDGMGLEEAKKLHPLAGDLYAGRIGDIDLAGMEPIREVQARSISAINRFCLRHKNGTIAVVSHLFWIRSLLSQMLDIPFQDVPRWFAPTSITVANATQSNGIFRFQIDVFGDETHLEEQSR